MLMKHKKIDCNLERRQIRKDENVSSPAILGVTRSIKKP
jgi:hypothetical protein